MLKSKRYSLMFFTFFLSALLAWGQAQEEKRQHFSLPFKTGAVQLDMSTFQITDVATAPNLESVKVTAQSKPLGLMMTLWVEPAKNSGGAKAARDEWWPPMKKRIDSMGSAMKNNRMYETAAYAAVEYLIPEFQGRPISQQNVRIFIAAGDVWSEIHLSRPLFKPGDEKYFQQVLDTVKPLSEFDPGSMEYMGYASGLYMRQEYAQAAKVYQKALDLEKQDRTLNKTLWFVLVDNLGMSYGITKDYKRAREVFEYGLSQEPEYPLFYYNMACLHAELGELDPAIANLQKAFARRANVLPGEKMPDPMTDDSFARYTKNPAFVKAVKELPR